MKLVTKLKKKCLMCDTEKATVTVKPCEHQFCPGNELLCTPVFVKVADLSSDLCTGCARRMKLCYECRSQITIKEGLRKSSHVH